MGCRDITYYSQLTVLKNRQEDFSYDLFEFVKFDVNLITKPHAFGMTMPGRSFSSGTDYKYGFNGQEKVDEISGAGNHTTATFWEYDTRLGRRWNLDPKPNPSISNYATFANNPIWFSDALGDTIIDEQNRRVNINVEQNDDGDYGATYEVIGGGEISQEFMDNAGKIFDEAATIETGRDYINDSNSSSELIHINISDKTAKSRNNKLKFGGTRDVYNTDGNLSHTLVTIYEGSINESIRKVIYNPNLTTNQRLTVTGIHEIHHATNSNDILIRRTKGVGNLGTQHEKARNAAKKAQFDFEYLNGVYE
jgi:hypothetical protein